MLLSYFPYVTRLVVICALSMTPLLAADFKRGFTAGAGFQGSASTLGFVNRLDLTGGYVFNSNWSVEGGVPFYFIRPSDDVRNSIGANSTNSLGNIYAQTNFVWPSESWGFASRLTVTAPTGDKDAGLSTGRVTADWTNQFEYPVWRFTPFGAVGIANAVSDTMIFVRPYTSLGFTSHFDGGSRFRLVDGLEVAGSAYAIVPGGDQTIYSRLTPRLSNLPVRPGRLGRRGVFEEFSAVRGPADLARDHGVSTWVRYAPSNLFDVYGGYTRSLRWGLDTAFFGVGVNVKNLIHRGIRP